MRPPSIPCPVCGAACLPGITATGHPVPLDPLYQTYKCFRLAPADATGNLLVREARDTYVQHQAVCPGSPAVHRLPGPRYGLKQHVRYKPSWTTEEVDAEGYITRPFLVIGVSVQHFLDMAGPRITYMIQPAAACATHPIVDRPHCPISEHQLAPWPEETP